MHRADKIRFFSILLALGIFFAPNRTALSQLDTLQPFLPEGFQLDKNGEPKFLPKTWDQHILRPKKGDGEAFFSRSESNSSAAVKLKYENSTAREAYALSPRSNRVLVSIVNKTGGINSVTACTPREICVTVTPSLCNEILQAAKAASWANLERDMNTCAGINAAAAWAGDKAHTRLDQERDQMKDIDRFLSQVSSFAPTPMTQYGDGVSDFYSLTTSGGTDDKKVTRIKNAFSDGIILIGELCHQIASDGSRPAHTPVTITTP